MLPAEQLQRSGGSSASTSSSSSGPVAAPTSSSSAITPVLGGLLTMVSSMFAFDKKNIKEEEVVVPQPRVRAGTLRKALSECKLEKMVMQAQVQRGREEGLEGEALVDALQVWVGDRATARIVVAVSAAAATAAREGDEVLAARGNAEVKGSLTMEFNGVKQPKIPIERYLAHLVRYFNAFLRHEPSADSAGVRAILAATVYIDRLRTRNQSFVLNSFNIHRVFLTATLVAVKMEEDKHPSNAYMATLGGIDLKQMNSLESSFCTGIGFSLGISEKELSDSYSLYDPGFTHIPSIPNSIPN